jgi:hypothetical protein
VARFAAYMSSSAACSAASDWQPGARSASPTEKRIEGPAGVARRRRSRTISIVNEMSARFSPDGRSFAYVADESGRNEVYVRPVSGDGEKTQISILPRLRSPHGRVDPQHNSALGINTCPLFADTYSRFLGPIAQYVVAPDGRFLVRVPSEEAALPTYVEFVTDARWMQ